MATTNWSLAAQPAARRPTPGRVVSNTLRYAAAVLVLLITGLPYLFMFATALKEPTEFIANLWGPPRGIALSNFGEAIAGGFGRYFVNSLIVSVVSVVLFVIAFVISSAVLIVDQRRSES